jgi:hypothetical protein
MMHSAIGRERLGAFLGGFGLRHRSRRVTLLMLGIIVLSFADLVVTLAYLQAQGMVEANPIAAYLIRSTRSPEVLIAFKLVTVGICVALLYKVRQTIAAEVAAWCAMLILTALSVMWHSYASHFAEYEHAELAQVAAGEYQFGPP